TSSRKTAIELWHTSIPEGDRIQLAKTLFCVENPPGTEHVAGSQDQLGMLLPGISKLTYDNGFWPVDIKTVLDDKILSFVERHIWLVALPLRKDGYSPYTGKDVTAEKAARLARATEEIWEGIAAFDVEKWGRATTESFEAQIAMFPNMLSPEMKATVEEYRDVASGWKVTGAGGGGYMVFVSEHPIANAIQVQACRA
ncbi:MAG: cytidyltransferase, partial [Lentisphaeria bacterium]|nr:cytidyltransferase [Lentisphaeria bacterium]